jgi:AcrR family transcriptional regulator
MRVSSQKASPAAPQARVPQQRRGRARVAALLEAAAAEFAANGYEAATMTAIAARAGASIGSLYQYFPTKELIAEALHAENAAALSAMIDGLRAEVAGGPVAGERRRGRSAAALVDTLLDGLAAFLVAHPAFVVLADRRGDSKRKTALRARLRGQIASLLGAATPPVLPARAAVMAVIVLHVLKAAVTISGESDLSNRAAVLGELRAMLRRHLS